MSLLEELKRRNVFKVGIAYVVIAWLVTQVLQVVLESFGSPDWVMKTVLVLMGVGLIFALFFAWAFELTSEGIKRESDVDRSQSITNQTGRKLNQTTTVILVLALGYFIFDKFVLDPSRDVAMVDAATQLAVEQSTAEQENPPPAAAETDKSIAVLPFVNMSGDQENEYFSDGLTEELLNALARINELKVTGRTSSFAFKGKNTDLREIGKQLGVAHILEGSVRKVQNRVRITAQLVKADDGYHMWSDTFDRELDDIFAIQEEIATRVASELSATLLGMDSGLTDHGTTNTEAYEAYLRGRYLYFRNPDNMQVLDEVDLLFDRALALDPNFTLAWFGKFFILSRRQRSGVSDYHEGAAQMRVLADKLVLMDPELTESYVAQSRTAMVEMNWSAAETASRHALELSPGNIDAQLSLAGLLGVLNRPEEALQISLMTLKRDPLDLRVLLNVTNSYSKLGRCDEAQEISNRALSLEPEASRFHSSLAVCRMQSRADYAGAIVLFKQEPLEFLRNTGLAIAYHKNERQDLAQQHLDELIANNGDQASYQLGQIYAQWGDKEKALDALEHAHQIGDTGFVLINRDQFVDPLRQEPRFKALIDIWQDPNKQ